MSSRKQQRWFLIFITVLVSRAMTTASPSLSTMVLPGRERRWPVGWLRGRKGPGARVVPISRRAQDGRRLLLRKDADP
jgi:hypothetical protein